ncbi:hypothetical protein ASE92_11975 [Pedobacter sp. Leaf41]|nr:hypothetical protein ASE92_11975 [Pedobacter sp. Leaf41]
MPFYSRWSQKVGEEKLRNILEERLNAGKSKGGRPVKKIKREKIIMVRLSKTDHFMIEGKANKAGIKISEWFRQAAKAGKVSPRISPEDLKVFRILAGMANNLNQLTKLSHEQGLLVFQKKCRELIGEIHELIAKYFRE